MTPVLVVEDDDSVRQTVVTFLELEGFPVHAVSSTREALEALSRQAYPVVLTDIYLDDRTGLDVLAAARTRNPECKVILMTARGTMETVMAATENGAFDYIAKPFDFDNLLAILRRASGTTAEGDHDGDNILEDLPDTGMIGSAPSIVEIYKMISQVAPTDATVLLEGETGTGKELIARLIHRNSRRRKAPFVAVDCASIAPTLIEAELFGAVKGAYTGAERDRAGVFEAADSGTVFLDEIGEIELAFQLRLLRFLQEREIRPVGSAKTRAIDLRVIAATNRNLPTMVESGEFREDLWYRLNVVRILVPPLRERRGDIPLLAHYFLRRYNSRYGLAAKLTDSGVKALECCTWPGNVRQLEHLIERLAILAPEGRIDRAAVESALSKAEDAEGGDTLAEAEAEQIRRVLAAAGGNKTQAAKMLGIERKTLYRKLERLGPQS